MGVSVDERGQDEQAAAVEHPFRAGGIGTERLYPSVPDAYVGDAALRQEGGGED